MGIRGLRVNGDDMSITWWGGWESKVNLKIDTNQGGSRTKGLKWKCSDDETLRRHGLRHHRSVFPMNHVQLQGEH